MSKLWKPNSWLLFIYKVPSEPARKRTFVWRKLNRMHALYLQQAVCLLPDSVKNAEELENLTLRIREFEGEATLFQILSKSKEWEKEIKDRFESARGAKHEKLQEEIKKFVEEIHFEIHRKRFTVEEVEELEEKLETLERWYEKLRQEEPVSSHLSSQTKVDLDEAANQLDLFAEKVERFEKKSGPVSKIKSLKRNGNKKVTSE